MRAILSAMAIAALVSGCLLPPPAQLASLVVQGITLAATDKTVTDHGISMVTGQDCALWRGIKGQPVCDDGVIDDTAGTAFALNVNESEPVRIAPSDIADDGPYFDAAAMSVAGRASVIDMDEAEGFHATNEYPSPEVTEMAQGDLNDLDNFVTAAGPEFSQPSARAQRPDALAFVVGSFRVSARARALARRHADFKAIVVRAQVRGRDAFRVVVGPVRRQEKARERARLAEAGLPQAWAIPYDPASWAILPPGTASTHFHNSLARGIAFPVSSPGLDAKAMLGHRRGSTTPRGRGKSDPKGGAAQPPAALPTACDAPASRRGGRLTGDCAAPSHVPGNCESGYSIRQSHELASPLGGGHAVRSVATLSCFNTSTMRCVRATMAGLSALCLRSKTSRASHWRTKSRGSSGAAV